LKTYKIIILKKKSNLLKIVYIAKQSASATYAPPRGNFFFLKKKNCFNILIAIQWNLFYSHISCNGRDKPRKLNAETAHCHFLSGGGAVEAPQNDIKTVAIKLKAIKKICAHIYNKN
jgi:hypothetical protein